MRIGEQVLDRADQLGRLMAVRVQPSTKAELVHALCVVVLIPEEGENHHRLAEVQ